jgi:protocatechuate 3,4-dioxygenase beta subunit
METNLTRKLLVLVTHLFVVLIIVNSALAWTLSGTVNRKGAPLPDAKVSVYNTTDHHEDGSDSTDSSGNYSITVDNGTYNLLIAPPLASGLANSPVSGVLINNADITQDFVLVQPANYLSGVVSTGSGVGVSNVKVIIFEKSTGTLVGEQITDGKGGYSIPVSHGVYNISIVGGPEMVYDFTVCGGYCFPNVPSPQYFQIDDIARDITVTGNTLQNLVLPLVTVRGKTTDSNGVPVAGVKITQAKQAAHNYFNSSKGYYIFSESDYISPDSLGQVISDKTGSYELGMFVGVGYSLSLIPPAKSGFVQTFVNNFDVFSALEYNVTFQQANRLSGVVSTGGGVGVSNVKVIVFEKTTGTLVGEQITDGNGGYSIPVSTGIYNISIMGGPEMDTDLKVCGGHCYSNVPTPQYFQFDTIARDISVAGNTRQNLLLPLVSVRGKTTDGNGAPVAGVKIIQEVHDNISSDGCYSFSESSYISPTNKGQIISDTTGSYEFGIFIGKGYSLTLIPPANSGFAQTIVHNFDVLSAIENNFTLKSVTGGISGAAVTTPVSNVSLK